MKARVSRILAVTLLGFAICRSSGAETNAIKGLQIHFEPSAVLSDRDMATVIQLAKRCGISNAIEIDTFYYQPSSSCGISVKSAETIRGRKISFVTVIIDREKWRGKEARQESKVLKSIGEYWVSKYGVITNVLTIFSVNGGVIRVNVSEDIPLPTADKIIDAFAAGRVRFLSAFDKSRLRKVEFSKPESLNYTKEGFYISYPTGPLSWVVLGFTLDGSGVTVRTISEVVV